MQQASVALEEAFKVLAGNGRSQAAEMVIPPGGSEGGPGNRHRGSDQWLYVAAGRGMARVGEQDCALSPGTLLLIEQGETHEVRNTGAEPLRTLNLYVPPAYRSDGEPLPRGES